jgi:hypothetical protein
MTRLTGTVKSLGTRSTRVLATLLALCVIAVALPHAALAHHSGAEYDFGHVQHLQGVVQSIRVINPHMSLTLVVSDARGTHPVLFEGHSVNNFYRAGWRPNMIHVGDHIQVTFAPRKDGAQGGFVNGFVTAGGRTIAFMVAREGGGVYTTPTNPTGPGH